LSIKVSSIVRGGREGGKKGGKNAVIYHVSAARNQKMRAIISGRTLTDRRERVRERERERERTRTTIPSIPYILDRQGRVDVRRFV
jgi:hypothetical protein